MRSKPPRWAIRNCSEPEDDTDTIAASALRDKLAGCVARFADRRDDWSVFGFETALDPKFARAPAALSGRLGFGRSQRPARLDSATAFTMSIQSMPSLPAGRGVQRRRQHLPSADLARQAAAATSAVQRPGGFEAAGGYSMSTTRITVADRTPEGFPLFGTVGGPQSNSVLIAVPCPYGRTSPDQSDSGRSGLMA